MLPTSSLSLLIVLAAVCHVVSDEDDATEEAVRADGGLRFRRTAKSSTVITEPYRRTSKRRGNVQRGLFSPMSTRLLKKDVPNTARFEVSLRNYVNDGMKMSGGYTCDCMKNRTGCTFLDNVQTPCFFSYTAIVYTPNEIGFFSTYFKPPVNKTENQKFGSLPFLELSNGIAVFTKPTHVAFLIHNLGLVINESDQHVVYFDYLWLVDSFELLLHNVHQPMLSNETTMLVGNLSSTILTVEYSFYCIDDYVGNDCELNCTDFQGGSDAAKTWLCCSVLSDRHWLCDAPTREAVNSSECRECRLRQDGSECVVLEQLYAQVDAQSAALVSPMWRWLSLALLIFLVLFVVFALLIWLFCRRESRDVADRDRLILGSGGAVSPQFKEYAPGSPLSGGGGWTKPAVPPAAVTHGVYRAQPAWADSPSVSSHDSHFNTDYRYPSGQVDSSMRREAQV